MMNFKKNQNNAVCSMDCKNCPNGASQPNPMDDPMFEKSIAMLHNWAMLEAIREDHPKERIVMVILPGAGGELLTEDGSRDIFEDVYDEMEADLVADGELLLHYDTAPDGTSPTGNWHWSSTVRITSGSCCQTTANRRSSPASGFFFFSLNCCAGSRRSAPLPRRCWKRSTLPVRRD